MLLSVERLESSICSFSLTVAFIELEVSLNWYSGILEFRNPSDNAVLITANNDNNNFTGENENEIFIEQLNWLTGICCEIQWTDRGSVTFI